MSRSELAGKQWGKERPDIDPFPMQLIGLLAELNEVIAREKLNPLFLQYELHPGEFDVLATLRRAGQPYALTPTNLYEATMISSGGMTNRIDRLERAELIERKAHPTDRRGTMIILTSKGLKVIDELLLKHVENEVKVLSGLDDIEQKELYRLLEKLMTKLV